MTSFVKKIICVCCVVVFSTCGAKVSADKVQVLNQKPKVLYNKKSSSSGVRKVKQHKPKVSNKRKLSNSEEQKAKRLKMESKESNKRKLLDFEVPKSKRQKVEVKVSNKRKLSDFVVGKVKRQKTGSINGSYHSTDNGRIVVNVDEGVMKPINIALYVQDHSQSIKEKFLSVIENDLQGTGLFRAIPNAAFMQDLRGVDHIPTFQLWNTINAEYLMNAEIRLVNGKFSVEFVLYDVSSSSKIRIFSVSGDSREWRKIAHKISNAVYERIVGETGYFDTKVLYVATERNKRGVKKYRLAIMDQDGYNHQYLTNGKTTVLTPRFSPNGDEFSFFAYREKIVNKRRVPLDAQIYRYDLRNGKMTRMLNLKGMNYAPRYSPDGKNLIFSLSEKTRKGRVVSSIFRYDISNRKLVRVTDARKYICIDTSPCYSPDGKHIVFNSDRGGNQQLYIMDADGSNIRRLSYGNGRYATPVWSPRGDWIAFTKFGKDGFFIGIIRPNDISGSTERMIAAGYLVEGPTWAPNGRVVMYSQQDYARREKVYSVDITGHNKRLVKTPGNAIDPEWSAKSSLD